MCIDLLSVPTSPPLGTSLFFRGGGGEDGTTEGFPRGGRSETLFSDGEGQRSGSDGRTGVMAEESDGRTGVMAGRE